MKKRKWTEQEDALIRKMAHRNMHYGITDEKGYSRRLRDLARKLDRTYNAVRMRASRIGALSYAKCAQFDVEDEILRNKHGKRLTTENDYGN